MARSAANQLKIGSLLSYVQMFLGVIISLLYTPVMLRLLGKSEYGLYNTVSSTISMLSLLSLGFNSGYIRYYTRYKQNDDTESIWKLNGLFLIVFIIIGVIGLLCGIFLSFHLDLVFSDGLTAAEYRLANVLMILLSINLAISFPMSVFGNIISANERFVVLKAVGILKTVVGPLVTLPLLLMGYRAVAMVVVTLVLSGIADAVYVFYVVRRLHNRFVFHGFEKGLFADLFLYTAFISVNLVVDQINWNVDKIILGRMKGTGAVAEYSVGYTLFQYYMMFSTSISSVFTPRIHRIVQQTKDDPAMRRKSISDLFIKVGRIQFLLLGLIASGFIFFGSRFITDFWAGAEYTDAYHVALLLMLPASIALIQNVGIEVQRAQNTHWFRAIVYAGMAALNIAASIVLCRSYGAVGCAIGTAISLVVANGIIMNFYYHRRCSIDILLFWKNILKMLPGLAAPVCFGLLLNQCAAFASGWGYLLGILLYIVVYGVSVWMLSMNAGEKALFSKPVQKALSLRSK